MAVLPTVCPQALRFLYQHHVARRRVTTFGPGDVATHLATVVSQGHTHHTVSSHMSPVAAPWVRAAAATSTCADPIPRPTHRHSTASDPYALLSPRNLPSPSARIAPTQLPASPGPAHGRVRRADRIRASAEIAGSSCERTVARIAYVRMACGAMWATEHRQSSSHHLTGWPAPD